MSDSTLHEFILLHQHHDFPRSVTDQLLLDMYHLLSAEQQAELDIHVVRLMAGINVTVAQRMGHLQDMLEEMIQERSPM